MPPTASERIEKFKAKFSPTVVSERFTKTADLTSRKVEVRQTELATIRDDVRQILNQDGIAPLMSGPYQAFANKLYGLLRSGGSIEVLQPQAQAYGNAWVAQGCVKTAISDILVYFGFSPLP
jgi:hypothetical protein